MTDDVKKAAEEFRSKVLIEVSAIEMDALGGPIIREISTASIVPSFIAGDAHGFARAVKMLREFKDERNSLRIPALHMADWLEQRFKE